MIVYKLEVEWDFGLNVTNNIGVFETEEGAWEFAKRMCESSFINFDEARGNLITVEEIKVF